MWYSRMRAFDLIMAQGFSTNHYDFIVCTRYDLIINKKLDFTKLKKGKFYYEEMGQPNDLVSDWLNIGQYWEMKNYSLIFNNWYDLVNLSLDKRNNWCNELMIRDSVNADFEKLYLGLGIVRP